MIYIGKKKLGKFCSAKEVSCMLYTGNHFYLSNFLYSKLFNQQPSSPVCVWLWERQDWAGVGCRIVDIYFFFSLS